MAEAALAAPIKRLPVQNRREPEPAPKAEPIKLTIRPAIQFDASAILVMLYEMHEETPLMMSKINPNKTMSRIISCITNGYVLIAEDEETKELIGSVAIEAHPDWWGDDKHFGDLWYYVRSKFRRNTRAPVELISSLKTAIDEVYPGAVLRMGVFYGKDVDRKDKFFTKHGFTKAGSFFVRGM